MVANMKIEQDKENPGIHKVYQDGNEIKCITEVSLNINTDSFPEVNITIGGGCDFEGMADIHFDYSPYTVKESCKILREWRPVQSIFSQHLQRIKRYAGRNVD